jgi:hypothetical protein
MSSNNLAMALGAIATVARHIELCPELPHWAARGARAAISEYALAKLLGTGHRTLLLQELGRLFRTDFVRGLNFAAPILIRKLGSLMSTIPIRDPVPADRPFFYDLSPEFVAGSSGNGLQSRDRKMLDRLQTVDAVLAKSMAHGFDNCTK